MRFLRPFGVIDFLEDSDPRSRRKNPALAIDAKLQLELVPYASSNFPTHKLTAASLSPHFDRVLCAIAAFPRDYVLFRGAVFDELLRTSGRLVSRHEHRFRLPTSSGVSKAEYRFSNVIIDFDGHQLQAGVARSFATKGLPMAEYGKKCRKFYGTDGSG